MHANTQQFSTENIVESGLHPKPPPTLERTVLQHTEGICDALTAAVKASLARIKEAEVAAVERLNEFVPTEPLLTRKQTAAYLGIRLRQLDVLTRPGSTAIPFNKLGGLKRFRKCQIDRHLEDMEIKKRKVVL